jgi:hypothetical protein
MIDFFKEEDYEPGYSTEDKIVFGSLGLGGVIIILGMFTYGAISRTVQFRRWSASSLHFLRI